VSLYECDSAGNPIKAEPILEHTSSSQRSVEEAYEFFSSEILFDIFLQLDESIINATGQSMVASRMREPDYDSQRGISVPVETNPSRE
jgi:hypothetical protein